ncbi:MAG: ATP-binding protein [Filifactoraceae bacterium]
MFKSIRWRLISVYFILVFIAMIIVGVYITDQLERYNLDNVRQTLTSTSNNLVNNIIDMQDLVANKESIQAGLDNTTLPVDYEVSVVIMSTGEIIASTNKNFIGKYASDVLNKDVIINSLKSPVTEIDTKDKGSNKYQIKNMAFSFPPTENNPSGYVIYARAYLDSIYKNINQSKGIFLNATLIALVVTIFLGLIISKTITGPINDLKNKAIKMSGGDFSQRAVVKSNDEIGELASTFNYLTEKLDNTLEEVSSEKSKLDSIINHMNDGLLALDKKGNVVLYNIGFIRLLDIPSTMVLIGRQFNDIAKELNLDINFELIRYITRSNLNREKSKKFNLSNGNVINISPGYYSDDIGILKGYVILFQDVTESQRLEEMRKEFVANVSHELKTPITTIKTYSETLLSGEIEDKETAKAFLNVIDTEADKMTSLIRDLLQLSHIDYKKIIWDMSIQDPNKLIRDCIERLSLYVEEKNQSIIYITDSESVRMNMDKGKLQQVFMNIISNAIKYTPKDGKIEVRLEVVGLNARISIKDNGIGIPEEDIPRLFERFYRVSKGRSREEGGTGLGLSIAKHIVEGHKGTVEVHSKLGEGSTFVVTLPVDKTILYTLK